MRRFYTLLLLVAATLSAWAFEVGNFTYETYAEPSGGEFGKCTVTGLSSAGKNQSELYVEIGPSVEYNGKRYTVTNVEPYAFQNCTNIHGVKFNYGMRSIGVSAFEGCTGITIAHFPSSMKAFSARAFKGCTALKDIYSAILNPDNVHMEPTCFDYTEGGTLYIPYEVPADGNIKYLFDDFPTVKQTSGVHDIFMANGAKLLITNPSTNVSTPHEGVITGFSSEGSAVVDHKFVLAGPEAKPVSMDRPIKYVGVSEKAFCENGDIKVIDFSKATEIQYYGSQMAFKAYNLTGVSLGGGEVRYMAFYGCNKLTGVNLGSATKVGQYAFKNCSSLTAILVPSTVTSISSYDFVDGCDKLQMIIVDADNPEYATYDWCLYNKDLTRLERVPEGYTRTSIDIAPTTSELYISAMDNCNNIVSVDLPYGVTEIGASAFGRMSALEWVKIPGTITKIGNYAFKECDNLTHVYVNASTPPTITATNVFDDPTKIRLHTPSNDFTDYKTAGWTGFLYPGTYGAYGYDFEDSNKICYDITRTDPLEIDGETYDGAASITRGRACDEISGDITIPDYITVNSKRYAVNRIGEWAFVSRNEFSLKGCKNVASLAMRAFYQSALTSVELPAVTNIMTWAFGSCDKLEDVKWGSKLSYINGSIFRNSNYSKDIILPYGFKELGLSPFAGSKVKRIVIPSTVSTYSKSSFDDITNLEELVVNSTYLLAEAVELDFTNVPTSAKIFVPVRYVDWTKNHKSWKRFSNVQTGAYDFAYRNEFDSQYTMSITSGKPVTVDGVTYDGTARYVKNPRIKSKGQSIYYCDQSEEQEWIDVTKKYLMTGVGDELLYDSPVVDFPIYRMTGLENIGSNAFSYSKVWGLELPASGSITVLQGAFSHANNLREIFVPAETSLSIAGSIYGDNAANFNFFVRFDKVKQFQTLLKRDNDETYVAPWFEPTQSTFALGALSPLDFEGSGVNAYAVTGLNSSTGKLNTKLTASTTQTGAGFILTDLEPGDTYKIKTLRAEATAVSGNLLTAVNSDIDIKNRPNAHYWDAEAEKFVRPTTQHHVKSGSCILTMAGGDLFLDFSGGGEGTQGDVNSDGTIDVTDVNLTVNVMLGKATISDYPAADVNGDGTVDVTDVNLIINLMLGK